jgi:carbonic anhydrase/acetyltransferase-like protein (isoleucine patch superfamily)
MTKAFKDISPSIDATAFVAETAVVIGDVHIGSESSIWYNVIVRGDVNSIRIGARTNIQDLSLLHVTGRKNQDDPGCPLIIGSDVTIGHGTTIHGCMIENGAFIGMKAMVMDRAVVGAGAMVAAGSLVTEGTVIQPGTLWVGSPARFKRVLTPEESARNASTSAGYRTLAKTYRNED